MTQEAKLKKIIEKAVEGGWPRNYEWVHSTLIEEWYPWEITHTLFDHSFAKAIWGEEKSYCSACERQHLGNNSDCDMGCGDCTEAYKYHLQQAVISDNPIDYYYENL